MRISDWSSDVCSSDLTFAVSPRRPIASPLAAIETCFAERGAPDRSVRNAALTMWPEMAPPISGHHASPFGADDRLDPRKAAPQRSEEHTSELQSLMRISYAVFCLKKKNDKDNKTSQLN